MLSWAAAARADLVSHWSFEEGSGGTAADPISGNNGTLAGNTAWSTNAKIGGSSLSFDGTSGTQVNVGLTPSLMPTSAISLSTWVNVSSFNTPYSGVLSNIHDTGADEGGYQLAINNSGGGRAQWAVASGGIGPYTNAGSLSTGDWYHLAGTFDGTNQVLYVNGQQVASVAQPGNIYYSPSETQGFVIGAYLDNDETYRYVGLVDDSAVWNHALTGTEIAAIYNLGNNNQLNYSAEQANQLFDAFALGDRINVGGIPWIPVSGLTGNAGDLTTENGQFILNLDGVNGLQTQILTPEPSTMFLLSLGAILLYGGHRFRQRRRAANG